MVATIGVIIFELSRALLSKKNGTNERFPEVMDGVTILVSDFNTNSVENNDIVSEMFFTCDICTLTGIEHKMGLFYTLNLMDSKGKEMDIGLYMTACHDITEDLVGKRVLLKSSHQY